MSADLKAIIRMREWEVDEKRRDLGVLLDQEAEVERRRTALDEEIARENAQATALAEAGAVGEMFTLGPYTARARERRQRLDQDLAAVRKRVETARDELAELFKDLKTYELAQEARDLEEKREADRKEQESMDEIGLELYRRREG